MSEKPNSFKSDFLKILLSSIEHDTNDADKAKEYLMSQGVNYDDVVKKGLTRIKRAQLKVEGEKTSQEMVMANRVKEQATTLVEELLKGINFSLSEFVRQEGLSVSFANLKSLSDDDIKNILIKHYTLKLLKTDGKTDK